MSLEDTALTREIMREIGRHPVDATYMQVHVSHGVVYLTGRLNKMRGYHQDTDLEESLHLIAKAIKQKPGIRDVSCEVMLTDSGKRVASGRGL